MQRTKQTLSKILVLSESDVQKCLSVSTAIEVHRKALGLLRSINPINDNNDNDDDAVRKGAFVPTRIGLPYYPTSQNTNNMSGNDGVSAADWSLFKPAAYYPSPSTTSAATTDDNTTLMGMKLVSVRSNNPSIGKPLVPANIILVDASTGELNALVGGTYLTALRTAAGSAVATQLCLQQQLRQGGYDSSERSSHHLVIFGAGLQAKQHLQTIRAVCHVDELTIVNRTMKTAEEWKDSILSERQIDSENDDEPPIIDRVNIISLDDSINIKHAVGTADVICTTTNSTAPLFRGEWVKPGCHINCIGGYTPFMKEVDGTLVNRCK
eukprot:8726861-Ditylum_brightwellii.AAC.1